MSKLLLALITATWYWIGGSFIGYTIYPIVISPSVIGLVFGLLYGNVTTGLIAGASLEVIYIGMVNAGGNLPADRMLAALIAIPVVLETGMKPAVAVSIAIPIGIIGVFINNIRRTGNSFLIQWADKYAEEENIKGISRCATLYSLIFGFFLRFPIVFVANYFGAGLIKMILGVIPAWLMNGLTAMGGVLPALGFAMTIFVIGKNNLIPLFLIGYFMVAYFKLPIMGAAIFSICLAVLIMFWPKSKDNSDKEAS
ncbi:PTS sugar transporter subunit IIC [Lactobacillus sp. ESL0791]|uniref:PTS mannose/fructose/sorbose/N-acetylgalactosamine transporter subunit IIC n=1 Tax=Lactobacillus sp. ESL0791 TaxID=2983234 RepID=UPI0023F9C4E8|nr:PTS sugar transporter subunit IIC [Lactobacillus sp. ESL0791]MDF7639796.1 PTS sugar transporter subunit IIC [Lactobacillus sp. ESL0791]